MREVAEVALSVLDPGSVRAEWNAIFGSFRGHPLVIEKTATKGGAATSSVFSFTMSGQGCGSHVSVSAAQLMFDAARKVSGDPTFDARFDVIGSSRAVNVALFGQDPDLRARMLAQRSLSLKLDGDQIWMHLPRDLTAADLWARLDIAATVFERLPAAMQRAQALEQAGGPMVELHPDTRAAAAAAQKGQRQLFLVVGIVLAVVVVVPLLLAVGCVAVAAIYGASGPFVLPPH